MTSIVLQFASIAALTAALPYLEKTPGLVAGQGNVLPSAANAEVKRTAEVAAVGAQEPKDESFDLGNADEPKYTFEQVGKALGAYQKADKAAFGAAMNKFGFKSPKDIEAAPEKWNDLMSYIGADEPAAKTYTAEEVEAALKAYAQKDQKSFGALMNKHGFKSMKDVQAASDKWADLMAAIA